MSDTGQQTTAGQRQALRRRYTQHPDWWMIGGPEHKQMGDPDVLAAVADADALAAALERSAALERGIKRQKELQLESNGVFLEYLLRATRAEEEVAALRSDLAFYKPEAERYRAALVTIGGWDCLNPPQAQLLADLPWLRRLVDDALAPADGAQS